MTKLLERPEETTLREREVEVTPRREVPVHEPLTRQAAPKRGVRWIRWMAAIVVVVAAATLAVVALRDGGGGDVTGTSTELDVAVGVTESYPNDDLFATATGTSHPLDELVVPAPVVQTYTFEAIFGTEPGSSHPLAEVYVEAPITQTYPLNR